MDKKPAITRPVNVEHYDDLIAIKLGALGVMKFLEAHRDTPEVKYLEMALKSEKANRVTRNNSH